MMSSSSCQVWDWYCRIKAIPARRWHTQHSLLVSSCAGGVFTFSHFVFLFQCFFFSKWRLKSGLTKFNQPCKGIIRVSISCWCPGGEGTGATGGCAAAPVFRGALGMQPALLPCLLRVTCSRLLGSGFEYSKGSRGVSVLQPTHLRLFACNKQRCPGKTPCPSAGWILPVGKEETASSWARGGLGWIIGKIASLGGWLSIGTGQRYSHHP